MAAFDGCGLAVDSFLVRVVELHVLCGCPSGKALPDTNCPYVSVEIRRGASDGNQLRTILHLKGANGHTIPYVAKVATLVMKPIPERTILLHSSP